MANTYSVHVHVQSCKGFSKYKVSLILGSPSGEEIREGKEEGSLVNVSVCNFMSDFYWNV